MRLYPPPDHVLPPLSPVACLWRRAEVKTIPVTDMQTLDSLWTTASKGKFGFSVQKEMWQQVGSETACRLLLLGRGGGCTGGRAEGRMLL